ncbi:MAG: cellulose biosynthesis protein BcsS [Nitrobacter sp.]|nr:cellulose biosynthesis protein BcsS [Nitrobacter sp.]OJU99609.1 MAG: cellulose biosynthesis protein BcsS [Nitrobacter sp. 62-23]
MGASHAVCLAALLMCATTGRPLADPLVGGFKPERFLFFSGVDLWRNGQAGYAGMLLAPQGGLNNDGFLVRLFMSDDFERYDTPTQRFTTNIFRASVLPGWRVKRGNVEIKVFAGPALESHALKPDIPTDKLRGSHFGARIATELWWEPLPAMMVAAAASATTIGSEYSARAAAGWRFLDRFWVGPEVCASADEYSTQYRIGAHLTGFKTGPVEWSVGAGFVEDSFNRSGIYGRIGMLSRR